MRLLLSLVMIAAIGWSGYWYMGQAGVTTGFSMWFDARRAEGWAADYSDLTTRGFPNRFDTTFTDLTLADPDTGLAWDTPFFQLLALSYRPNHVIAVWPKEQRISTPIDKFTITSTDMRASAVTDTDIRLSLERITLTATEMAITPASDNQPTRLSALRLAAERTAISTATYRFGLAADGLAPALPLRVQLDPAGTLPDTLDALSADITVEFDKAWDRSAIEDARPQPRRIDIRLAEARWGRLELQVAGEVRVDAAGRPEGEITIKARNWRDILNMATASGSLPPGFADTLEDGLSLLSQIAGNPKTLDIPLTFASGRVKLGPVPLGPAPVLKLR